MFLKKNTIVVTGGRGRFAQSLKKIKSKYKFYYPSKKNLDITNVNSIKNYLSKIKPSSVLHLAGLSRPMSLHEKEIKKSINLNIIGTANLVSVCHDLNIKLIYFSTSYIYPGKSGNYKETDALLPWNNYGWSKLGGESSVQMYKNSLILRVCMTEKPFIHKKAFTNVKLNFIFHENLAKILIKIISKKGIINLGGPTKTVYDFARQHNPKVKKILNTKYLKNNFPLNPSMSLSKLKSLIK
jgi:dTDP-4-dehydrorhamnose reductase